MFCFVIRKIACFSTVKQPKQKLMGKPVKTPSLNWMDALPPPPLSGDLDECEEEDDNELIQDMG